MGEAKRRGSAEERKRDAIDRARLLADKRKTEYLLRLKEEAERRQKYLDSLTPEEREVVMKDESERARIKKMARAALVSALGFSVGSRRYLNR